MAGYSGTPLHRQLGITAESTVLLDGAPEGFDLAAQGPPHRRPGSGPYDVVRAQPRDPKGRQMIIPKRFNGPPDTGNGGYTSGLVAAELAALGAEGAVEVTLRVPPPLAAELAVTSEDGGIAVRQGDTLVATARPASVTGTVPFVPHDEAVAVSHDYPGFSQHPFPTCYACGPERSDGLRLFPGRLPERRTAAPLTIPDDVTPATIWAALDCPGGWAIAMEMRPYVMGRMIGRVDTMPAVGERCVVTGKLLDEGGRKAHVATTVWSADGSQAYATARATWIAMK